ncbi:hypothetical protein OESDEN_03225 [Oesophagostomum dentatum]|uniref:RRM domain-containing protein n=1 Tax=Oesophagostomum dentatum TaxID=61180 RepID=A0A0B1THR9_OESDE|nr:hypothetical protein OESDEN_03225 [Oesophagostomum dentatum]
MEATLARALSSRDRRESRRSRSRSPRRRDSYARGRRDSDDRCLGCFNLSVYTTEKDLRELFGEFGEIEKVELVYDHPTGRSRGFGFVYFERLEDACVARDKLTGQEIDGHKIRVDFSLTKRAHTPTPGQYMGAIRGSRRNYGYGGGGYRYVVTSFSLSIFKILLAFFKTVSVMGTPLLQLISLEVSVGNHTVMGMQDEAAVADHRRLPVVNVIGPVHMINKGINPVVQLSKFLLIC